MTGEDYEAAKDEHRRDWPGYAAVTDIQRWEPWQGAAMTPKGEYVLYADHVEALRQAEQRGIERGLASRLQANAYRRGYEQGQREMLTRCLGEVYRSCGHTKYEGCRPCIHDEIIAAIKGDSDE